MDYEFAGLPLHVLLVHVVIVGIPLLAALLVVIAAWRAARRVLWLPAVVGAFALLGITFLTIEAGKWLEQRVPAAPLIQEHTAQGEDIVPWLIALVGVAALLAALAIVDLMQRRRALADGEATDAAAPRGRAARLVVAAILTVAALGVGVGAVWTMVRIGEAGSRAVWEGSFSETPLD